MILQDLAGENGDVGGHVPHGYAAPKVPGGHQSSQANCLGAEGDSLEYRRSCARG